MKRSNTQLRIISAIIILMLVAIVMWLGAEFSIGLVGVIGLLALHEILINFFRVRKFKKRYFLVISIYILIFLYVNYFEPLPLYFQIVKNLGLILNVVAINYLFFPHSTIWDSLKSVLGTNVYLLSILLIVPFLNISFLLLQSQWMMLIIFLLLMNFLVDTGAWFFGKNFGKHKLMPSVSPQKTIEGAIGGVFSSVFFSAIYWKLFITELELMLILCFFIIACCAQIGDLVQSSLKRRFDLKDSSNLIPGHGGVYDRVDSLIFVAPLFVQVLDLFYF